MSHVSYTWVTSLMYESRLWCMSHVSYVWVTSLMYESCLWYMSHVSYVWVMSLIYESFDKPHFICQNVCMSHVPLVFRLTGLSRHTWVMSLIMTHMSHVSNVWVMSLIYESFDKPHFICQNVECLYESWMSVWVMSHWCCVWPVSHLVVIVSVCVCIM